jgi:hypothetical protein
MAGLGETLGSPWPPLAIRPCWNMKVARIHERLSWFYDVMTNLPGQAFYGEQKQVRPEFISFKRQILKRKRLPQKQTTKEKEIKSLANLEAEMRASGVRPGVSKRVEDGHRLLALWVGYP